MLAIHAEIARVFGLDGKRPEEDRFRHKANLQRQIEEKRFRFKTQS